MYSAKCHIRQNMDQLKKTPPWTGIPADGSITLAWFRLELMQKARFLNDALEACWSLGERPG